MDGYEKIYKNLIPRLSICNFSDVAERLGMSLQPDGTLSVGFLGREYEISARGVNSTDGKPVHVNNRSVLAYYTLSRGAGEPAFSFVPISHFASTCRILSTNIQWMTDPLGNVINFAPPSAKIGGASYDFGRVISATNISNGLQVAQSLGGDRHRAIDFPE